VGHPRKAFTSTGSGFMQLRLNSNRFAPKSQPM
jgi:hypothetical protein